MENEKQLSAVSSNTRNRGHKMKLVGGRLNKKKERQILAQHVAELWKSLPPDPGDTRTLRVLDTLMGKEKSVKGE